MKNKIWIIVIAVLLVLVVATLVITNVNKDEVVTPPEINMEVKRDESVDIDKIKENFNTNVQNIKDGANKTENE